VDRKRILVVDDEIYIVHILEFTLTMEGYEVLTAADGEEALQKIEQDRPDLVVVDIMMPKLDGYEVCRRLRQDEEFRSLPVILLSAKGRPIDRETGLEVGLTTTSSSLSAPAACWRRSAICCSGRNWGRCRTSSPSSLQNLPPAAQMD